MHDGNITDKIDQKLIQSTQKEFSKDLKYNTEP